MVLHLLLIFLLSKKIAYIKNTEMKLKNIKYLILLINIF